MAKQVVDKEQVDFSLLYPLIIETAKKATENLDLLELISLDALPRYSDLPLLQALFAFALDHFQSLFCL
jgi:hypothetical protein